MNEVVIPAKAGIQSDLANIDFLKHGEHRGSHSSLQPLQTQGEAIQNLSYWLWIATLPKVARDDEEYSIQKTRRMDGF